MEQIKLSGGDTIDEDSLLLKLKENPLVRSIYRVLGRVDAFKSHSKAFYFEVVLSANPCPKCHGKLDMTGLSECQCSECGYAFDPTTQFQQSPCCVSSLLRKTYHYACSSCNRIVPSRFIFDEKVFDRAYFREMMTESRKRRKRKREEMRRLLADSRSSVLDFSEAPDLESIPGMLEDLNGFIQHAEHIPKYNFDIENNFSMDDYRNHILSVLSWNSMLFSNITHLADDYRRDRIRRFITLIFMQNDQEVELTQDAKDIRVQKVYNEAYS